MTIHHPEWSQVHEAFRKKVSIVVWLEGTMERSQSLAQQPLCSPFSLSTAREPRHINKLKPPIKRNRWTLFRRPCQLSERLYVRNSSAILFKCSLGSVFPVLMVMTQSILGVGHFDLLKTHSQFILQRSWFSNYFVLCCYCFCHRGY